MKDRIRNAGLLNKVVAPEMAASIVRDGFGIGTSGEPVRGCATAFFEALGERGKRGEVRDLTLWSSNIINETEKVLAEAGILKRRMGSNGDPLLRKLINEGRVECNDLRSGILPYLIRSKVFGKLDLAVIDAVALTEEGFIIPSHAPVECSSYAAAADQIIVEIDLSIPMEVSGFYDHYLTDLQCPTREIPIYHTGQRIGTPYIPVDPKKIKYIVVSDRQKAGAKPSVRDSQNDALADHLVEFLKREVEKKRLPRNLFPIEIGLGGVADALLSNIALEFDNIELFGAVISDGMLDLIEAKKCVAASGTAMLLSDEGWAKFSGNAEAYKHALVLRPIEISNHPELVRRLRVIAINGALEADIYGQINSSHIGGVSLVSGIGGSADFAGNAHLSIFTLSSTSSKGKISSIVPMVSHVDHTEHNVDVIVTEVGFADLRGLSPMERAGAIIDNCAHPDYRPLLREYLEKAKKNIGGHEPHILEEAFSFHQRLKKNKTMSIPLES
ncbi:MAG: acetyl-CoA hydrolase/transferase C-terminal domain-containing protein [Smithellaceae bacterium]